jgi:AcrR family transcriptional regulator
MRQPITSRTRLDRAARRAQIIAAASPVFQGRDPADVTFEQIAEAAGVSRALVYNYFGDRRGLLEAIHEQHFRELQSRVERALATTRGRRHAFEQVIQVHLDFANENPGAYRAAVGINVLPHGTNLADQWIDYVARMFGGGDTAMMLGTGFLHAVQAMVMRWVEFRELSLEEAHRAIAAVLWKGLSSAEDLGLPVTAWWDIPQPV